MVINFSLRHMPKVIYIRFGIIIVQEYLNSELTKVSFLLYNRILRNTWGIIAENFEGEKDRRFLYSHKNTYTVDIEKLKREQC